MGINTLYFKELYGFTCLNKCLMSYSFLNIRESNISNDRGSHKRNSST